MRPQLTATVLAAAAVLAAGCTGETDDDVVDSVPANARSYVHLDPDADDWGRAQDALERLPALEGLVRERLARIAQGPEDGETGIFTLPGRSPRIVEPRHEAVDDSLREVGLYQDLLDGLPDERFAYGYFKRAVLGRLRTLDRSVAALAAGADVDGDLMRIRVHAAHDKEAGECSTGRGGSDLLGMADPDAAVYVEVPSIACAIRALAAQATGVGAALGRFGRAAERRGGVSLEKELLPLLDSPGALIATPGDRAPTFTLVVDDVDEQEALDVLSRLQPALIHLLQPQELGQAPTFGAAEVDGITAATAQLAPGLELSYAAWDGRLVVSTSLAGIRQARRAEGLPGTDDFEAVLEDRPSAPSALLFLDLDQLLALGEQAGLAEDPRYLAVRDDLQKLRAAGAVLSREENFTTAELTFQIP